jgi:hypothetical protein
LLNWGVFSKNHQFLSRKWPKKAAKVTKNVKFLSRNWPNITLPQPWWENGCCSGVMHPRLPTIGHLAKISTELILDSVAMVPRVLPGFLFFGFMTLSGGEWTFCYFWTSKIFNQKKYNKKSRIHFRSFQEENIFSYENFRHL